MRINRLQDKKPTLGRKSKGLMKMIRLPQKGKKLRWGIAGLGGFSESILIPGLQRVRRAKIQAVFSHTAARAKAIAEKYDIPSAFSSYEEFLQSGIDAVYIGSANADHHQQVIKAAAAGKHVLCDKPLALSSKEAEEMVEACKAHNVRFAVNYVYRFNLLLEKAKELIENQTIGKLISIDAHFNINFLPGDNFRYSKSKSGGGAIRDLGTHIIDMFRYLNGEMSVIAGEVDKVVYKSEVDDFACALLKFERGGVGYVNVSYNASRAANRVEIIGHKGTILIDNLINSRYASTKVTLLIEGEAKKAFRKRSNKQQRLLKAVTIAFLKNEEPSITGVDGLINLRLLEQIENYANKK
jgi:glucose-fructose oxidoreductase